MVLNKSYISVLGLLTLSNLLCFDIGCSGVNFGKDQASQSSLSCEMPDCDLSKSEIKSASLNVGYNTNNKVDILFVIDNSASMTAELQHLGSKFHNLTSALADSDWQACITTTDFETIHGALQPWSNASYVISRSTANFAQVFEQTVNSTVTSSGNPSDPEQGIRSASAAFALTGTATHGCFRTDTAKSVVIVSDEDELASGFYPGEKVIYTAQPENYPNKLAAKIASLFGSQTKFTAHAIAIDPSDSQCLASQRVGGDETFAYPGRRYKELTDLNHGVFVNLCSSDYSEPLRSIGETILDSKDHVDLDCDNQIELVGVDISSPNQTAHGHSLSGHRVSFSPALVSGESAIVYYRCLSK